MSAAEPAAGTVHGGLLVARRLRAHGTHTVFTLSGGHLFSFYDGCRTEGIRLIDTRHEQTAAFAAEGWAKVTREAGVAALTAGPGVTNGMSAMASAAMNRSPMVVIGGRAPAFRWGQGSLQEIDHIPFVRPVTRLAATADSTAEIPGLIDRAYAAALAPRSGPAFVDLPLDHVFGTVPEEISGAERPPAGAPYPEPTEGRALERAAALLADAERPVIMAGTGLYWSFGEGALRRLCERLRIPVFLNGLARGCLPADHELFFSRVRASAFTDADVAVVVGVPLDFRLGFGAAFGKDCEVVLVDCFEPEHDPPRAVAAECYGPVAETLGALLALGGPPDGAGLDHSLIAARERWIDGLRSAEVARRSAEAAELSDERAPLHPMRIYGELARLLDRDAIIVGDGGDFVSYAGRVVDSYEPGCWLDPGPYGCLGSGPGYALAAKLARPERQVVLLLGDGAFGFSGMEWDTLARHGVAVVGVMANNGIWALEKHPMEAIYGYSVVAELAPGTRYDRVVEALGCDGALVERPAELRPALEGALAGGRPALVNVMTDPGVAYPRRSNLA